MCRGLVRPTVLLLAAARLCAGAAGLPVFLSDNHAESFGWISRRFDLDARHLLVLVDAHSDASACERSEEMRERLRRVNSEAERRKRVEDWRRSGRLQAFNWIEPLMPRPVESVIWVAGEQLDARRAEALRRQAGSLCDGRLEIEPRSAGKLASRWQVVDLERLSGWEPGLRPVILSLDLDFFAGMEPGRAGRLMDELWIRAMGWPGLAGVCVSVSRPWLESDDEADRLVAELVLRAGRTRGARLVIDSSIDDRPDRSLRAGEFEPGMVPRWDFHAASGRVMAAVTAMGGRCSRIDRGRQSTAPPLAGPAGEIVAEGIERDLDGVWRCAVGEAPVLRVRGAAGRVRWLRLEPANDAVDLLPETGLGKGFSDDPARWVYESCHGLGESDDGALPGERWARGAGRYRIAAEIERDGSWLPLPPAEIRLAEGTGFRGALSECLRMPYVFGVAEVRDGGWSGVDSGWGSDCSNLLVHGWRRCGIPVEWGDPGRLRGQLRRVDGEEFGANATELVERGVAVDFGRHVAALWEDVEPRGRLDAADILLHHLGGRPELATLGEVSQGRPPYSLWTPGDRDGPRIRIAGDVVLAGDEHWLVDGFDRGGSDLFVANLEGVPSMREAAQPPRFDFRFPADGLDWLKEQGLSALSLANNHCGDAGEEGLLEALGEIRKRGIGCFGAGHDAASACRPWVTEAAGREVAFFGVSIVPTLVAGEDAGAAVLPGHEAWLEPEIEAARRRGAAIVVMIHGGDEYRREVNDEQRRWARWWIERGARVVVGAGPHLVQRSETHAGAVIHHSLGNAVYPLGLKGADGGVVVEVGL
jgi:hypothetical protein